MNMRTTLMLISIIVVLLVVCESKSKRSRSKRRFDRPKSTSSGGEIFCRKGQYLDQNKHGKEICKMCPADTFMKARRHRQTECIPCTQPSVFANEVVCKNCTHQYDTVIGCRPGYFHATRHGDCTRCLDCRAMNMTEFRPCGYRHDSVCCPEPGMVVVMRGRRRYKCIHE